MTIQTTRWKPDTCGCSVDYTWDDTTSEDARVHTFSEVIGVCPDHLGLTGVSIYNAIKGENTRKNILEGDLLLDSKFGEDVTKDGKTLKQFKEGISYDWSFTGSDDIRVLHVTISGITSTGAQKASLQSIVNIKFGVNKIVFD